MSAATPEYVPYPRPRAGAPNVLAIVLDDVGFAQLGCFGGAIATPNIDRLAAGGLRYHRFHVTSICSSTRAALLTGRNHHAVGVGMTMETPLGFPGYTGRIPRSAALLPRVMRDAGYNTFAVGKWHLVPRGEYSAAGPTTRWPVPMGFDRYYGFLGAETSQWAPELCRDNTLVDPPRTPAEGYHLSEDLADEAIRMILDQRHAAPAKPFLCWLAFGAAHAPHQVSRSWSDAYRGRFDEGWEALRASTFARQVAEGIVPPETTLTPRPAWVPSWDDLGPDERRLCARYMEVFAGFLSHADAQIGRVIDFLAQRDELDNTMVLLLSDNGASAEGTATGTLNEPLAWLGQAESTAEAYDRIDDIGGVRAFNHYPWGWAWAGNTPLQLWKRYAWLGGVRTPLIVHWPGHTTDPGAIRPQFCHAVDIFPTVLDAAGIGAPEEVDGVTQQRIDGASLLATFTDGAAPAPRATQYFEMHGSRAIYHEGWKATTDYVSAMFGEREAIPGSADFDQDRWSLFDLDQDFAEAHDLADQLPERLAALQARWWAEAEANQVLPLFEGPTSMGAMHPGEYPQPSAATYLPGGGPIYEGVLPALLGGFTAQADLRLDRATSGVIAALGDANDGWAFYFLNGRPVTTLVAFGHTVRIEGPAALAPGDHTVTVTFQPGQQLALSVAGQVVAAAGHPGAAVFLGISTAGGGMLVGRDRGLPFNDDYDPPFPFEGTLRRLVITANAPEARRPPADVVDTATRAD